jgi:hypothetical protein
MAAIGPSGGDGYVGPQDELTHTSQYNAMSFLVRQMLSRISTATVVQVVAVTNSGGVSPVGEVDVIPLVNQVDGAGNAVSHGTVYSIPYFRLQGGADAVILDPKVNDKGIAVFADHDISSVKANKGQANPGSNRRFDMADGLYLGGFLNGTPTQYVQFNTTGITVLSPTKITLHAPTTVVEGDLHVTQAVIAGYGGGDQVGLQTHTHQQGADGHGDAEVPTNAPTAGT